MKCNLSLSFSFSLTKIMDTDLAAVPAKTVSQVGGGGALLVHQQQSGKQSLQLQWDHSDLQRRREKNNDFTSQRHTDLDLCLCLHTVQALTLAPGFSLSSRHPNSSGPKLNSSSAKTHRKQWIRKQNRDSAALWLPIAMVNQNLTPHLGTVPWPYLWTLGWKAGSGAKSWGSRYPPGSWCRTDCFFLVKEEARLLPLQLSPWRKPKWNHPPPLPRKDSQTCWVTYLLRFSLCYAGTRSKSCVSTPMCPLAISSWSCRVLCWQWPDWLWNKKTSRG